ncbi:MAG TPA: YkvA family protein [Elusimicrobiota bacterium]|nr:YkvA family protein [Elusimicrobiota bacterium]HMZ26221.1 YkvA family protein [Elusimicrobiota bacterium]HNA60778.1 YkvA family protein [Elusimicrobiota bacterium]HNC73402.1 YkvA family protein [Elusimicrobiota bacterium]HND63322.1 YkvA family protein [Elusimicrobiota bacterium]
MLKAFQEKLTRLANDPQDPFRQRVTERVGPLEAPRTEAPLRRMILAMPDMLGQIASWSRELGMPQPLKRAQVFALAYIVNPEDFLPEGASGLYGYLDDAYIVAATYYRTMQEVGPAGLRPLTDNVSLALAVPEWVEAFRRYWPELAERIDDLLDTHLDRPDARRMGNGRWLGSRRPVARTAAVARNRAPRRS